MGGEIIPAQIWVEQEVGEERALSAFGYPPHLPPSQPPPPSRATGVTRGSNPPGWGSEGKGMRRGEGWGGGERITWPHSNSQLLERPLGEWTESFPLSPTPLIIKCC